MLKGKYVKPTGETLSTTQERTYVRCRKRHVARCKLGDYADKLTRIADKYRPQMADESRAFVMRLPEKAAELLLKRVRKIRRRIKAKQKGDVTGVPEQAPKRDQRVTKEVPEQSEEREGRARAACDKGARRR